MKERIIKMVGLDLDGTLLSTKKELLPHTRKILKKAMEQGVVVLVATGRPLSGIPRELLDFPGMRYVLTANGARIIDQKQEKVIYENLVSVETANRVLDIVEEYDTLQEVYFDGVGYGTREALERIEEFLPDPHMAKYIVATRKPTESIRALLNEVGRPTDKVQAIFSNLEERAEAIRRIKEEVGGVSVTGTLETNVEVNALGVNKGAGLLRLGELLGIRKDEIMACGDSYNDMDMIREAGFGVVMQNGNDAVKALADYITDTNDNEGVAQAIERFVLKGGATC
ncbi:MAG: Cof-type HAD-IIB family hydrolase [Hespellia sp.]|nr:Cof-type HAD-IIB family hydrolase [Hespellia sp.]